MNNVGIRGSRGVLSKTQHSPVRFRNFCECPRDGTCWHGDWACTCNDRCPTCRSEIEPYKSEDIETPGWLQK